MSYWKVQGWRPEGTQVWVRKKTKQQTRFNGKSGSLLTRGRRLTHYCGYCHPFPYTRLFMQASATHGSKGYVSGMMAACVVSLYVELSGPGKKNSMTKPRQNPVAEEECEEGTGASTHSCSALSHICDNTAPPARHLQRGSPLLQTTWSSLPSARDEGILPPPPSRAHNMAHA